MGGGGGGRVKVLQVLPMQRQAIELISLPLTGATRTAVALMKPAQSFSAPVVA